MNELHDLFFELLTAKVELAELKAELKGAESRYASAMQELAQKLPKKHVSVFSVGNLAYTAKPIDTPRGYRDVVIESATIYAQTEDNND